MADKKARRLYFNYDEPYTYSRKCKKLFWLKMENVEEDLEMQECSEPKISLHTPTKTIKVHSLQEVQPFRALVDRMLVDYHDLFYVPMGLLPQCSQDHGNPLLARDGFNGGEIIPTFKNRVNNAVGQRQERKRGEGGALWVISSKIVVSYTLLAAALPFFSSAIILFELA
ncbi:unnamed protein product [Dovyalis caffra]|uniref:Uncharacterized protein n=1 Tax=Dovyalis caffra TaxID=77055 RepID=A0AAV1QS61_9ROSI|nr:unnamed protein product [Dovyalis caffra]